MPGTTALPRGRGVAIRLADQADVSTQAIANFFEVNSYASAFNKKKPLDDDDVQGQAGYANVTDSRPAAPGLEDADGTMQVPMDMDQIGFHLKGLLGLYSVAAAAGGAPGGTMAHTFQSGALSLPARTIERQLNTGQFEAMIGAVVKDMTFPIGAEKGYAKADMSLWGKQVTDPYVATAAAAPTVVPLISRVPATSGVLRANGVQIGRVQSGNLKVTNDVQADRYAGDVTESDAFLQAVAAQLSVTARYTTDALRTLGATGGVVLPPIQAVDLTWTLSTYLKLVITLPAVRFEPVSIAVTNGGLLTQQLSGRAEVAAGGPMLTAVLTNARATY